MASGALARYAFCMAPATPVFQTELSKHPTCPYKGSKVVDTRVGSPHGRGAVLRSRGEFRLATSVPSPYTHSFHVFGPATVAQWQSTGFVQQMFFLRV